MAKYFMQEMPDIRKEGETILYPRMEITGTCETLELVESSIKGSTFNKGEVIGALDLIAAEMARIMADGRSVRINGIGLFTPSLSLKKGKERESVDGKSSRRNAGSIRIGDIKFRADDNLVTETNINCTLERGSYVRKCKISKFTSEERLSKVIKYLESNPFITITEYSKISGLSRSKAGIELKSWAEKSETGLKSLGKGSHKVYVKKKQ